MNNWKEQVQRQAASLIREIAALETLLDPKGKSGSLDEFFKILERLYTRDLPLAELKDRSDLVFKLVGAPFEDRPRMQLVTSIFENVTGRITDLTKVILGRWADGRVLPSSLNLALNGIAPGSLVFGLSAEQDRNGEDTLLQSEDTLFISTKKALETVDLVAHLVEDDQDQIRLEEISERIEDPRIRDAALLAVQRLAPSGRRGIEKLLVAGQGERPAQLTPEHRRAIRESLARPVIDGAQMELRGYVREIDLDAHRFHLRGIDDEEIRDVRCAYRRLPNIRPRDLLGSYVLVKGLVERTADGVPRLLSVTDVEIRQKPPEDRYVDDDQTPLPHLRG